MGYTTWFNGSFEIDKPVNEEFENYINTFSSTRRMKRNVEKIKELYPNWKDQCFNGDLGVDGEYFIGSTKDYGQNREDSIVDYNHPPKTQPGLWCQWIIENNQLIWDEGEKFYDYIEWLKYMIENFFEPSGYKLNGEVEWQGEDYDDFGIIEVEDNIVYVKSGERSYRDREIV